MAAQSFAMGEAFGKGFQYGKRRISAMDNKEFNSKDAKAHFMETTADIKSMVPSMKESMSSFAFLQQDIIKELLKYIEQTAGTLIEGVQDRIEGAALEVHRLFGSNPTAAQFASPAGISALLKWWGDVGSSPTIQYINDVIARIAQKFQWTPLPSSSIIWILDKLKTEYGNLPDSDFIGPSPPPDGVAPPDETFIDVDKDTREPFPGFTGLPDGRFAYVGRGASQSQELEYYNLIKIIKAAKIKYKAIILTSTNPSIVVDSILRNKQALADLIKRYGMQSYIGHEVL